jgi:hypothetical protein
VALGRGCPELSILDVQYCDGVSDDGVVALAHHKGAGKGLREVRGAGGGLCRIGSPGDKGPSSAWSYRGLGWLPIIDSSHRST